MAEIIKKYLSTTGAERLVSNIKTQLAEGDAQVLKDAKAYADGLADNYDAAGTAATKVQELADGQVKTNTEAIATLNGDANTAGSVDKKIADAKAELNQTISAVEGKADVAQADADALETDMGNVDNLSTTNKTVVGAINEVLAAVGTGGTAAVVTITTDTTTEGALKSYTIKQGDATVGVIDIPKDMVVQSGEVVTNPAGQAAGTYIKLVLANATNDEIYVNVGNLVDVYKAKASATQVQVAIDASTREISATVVAGSITSTELAADAVVTAKIADGNVTKAKMSTEVQASLDKADAAASDATSKANTAEANAKAHADGLNTAMDTRMQAVEGKAHEHSNKALLDTYTQTEANLADAVTKKHAHDNATVLDGITAAKVSAWDAAESNAVSTASADATNKANTAENNAKAHADGLNTAMDARVAALENVSYVEITAAEIDAMFNA